ncbi:hypothetical protein PSPO01_09146 [Paraphaeosphaeria sporulosa]
MDIDFDFGDDENTKMLEEDTESKVLDGDDEASPFGDSDMPTASNYSHFLLNTLTRMTELALTAHQNSEDTRSNHIKSPHPLPEVPKSLVGDDLPAPRGIRILTGQAMRRVRGLRIKSGGSGPSRILRIISGVEACGDEQPRSVWR